MTITLEQFKKFADDNDILWFYNKSLWESRPFAETEVFKEGVREGIYTKEQIDEIRKIYKDGELDALPYLDGNWHKAIFETEQKKEVQMKVNVEIAKICHEANRQYCINNQLKTQAKWDELPDDLQESIIAGVAKVIENPKITAEEMHDNWINYKAEQGWLYGDELDIAEKLHPNMVIWKKLSKVERGKDKLFLYIVKREMRA